MSAARMVLVIARHRHQPLRKQVRHQPPHKPKQGNLGVKLGMVAGKDAATVQGEIIFHSFRFLASGLHFRCC
jgi:hypothetical protein